METAAIPLRFIDPRAQHGDKEAQDLLLPRRHSALAAGFDLVASNEEPIVLERGRRALVPTGVAIALPPGFEAQVRPRSGLALTHGITCLNAPGTIDADYRGELKVLLINHGDATFVITRGLRIAQLVVARVADSAFAVVAELDPSARSDAGFGSTGV